MTEPIAGNPMADDEPLREFAKDVILQSWDGSLDEPYVQELGVKLGLLRKTVFDPAIHNDVNAYAEAGDPWYIFDGPLAARISRPSITADARWKLVPVDPTREMLDAVVSETQAAPWTDELMTGVYHDMLEAAPAHPAPEGAGEDPHIALHIYEGDSALVIRQYGNKTLHGVQLPELLALFEGAGDTEPGDLVEQNLLAAERLHENGVLGSEFVEALIRDNASALTSLRAENARLTQENDRLRGSAS